jgi:hypothetical protein
MQTAARLQLNSARIRASQEPSRVARSASSPTARVARLEVVSAAARTAYVVTVRNEARRAVSDLPISVGYTVAHHPAVYLNAQDTLTYFQAHLPAIPSGGTITWVYSARALPAGASPFAVVGARPEPAAGSVTVPPITVTIDLRSPVGERVAVRVHNLSGIPQYQLPIYAFARRGDRLVAAGSASVTTLDGGSEQTVQLPLLGDASGARLMVEAPPTIFN